MANKWHYVNKINFDHKPTPTQQALIAAIKASGKRVYDADSWNIRTVTALYLAGWLYVDCGETYKHVALVLDEFVQTDAPAEESTAVAEEESPIATITPLGIITNPDQLVDAMVQAKPFDDPVFKHEVYVGVIEEVKINRIGTWVHFKTPDLVGLKWIKLSKVTGFAHFAGMQKAAV